MSARFRLRDSRIEGCLVVAVSGDVDLTTAPVLRDHLLDRIELGERRLMVDLAEVGFLDSTGLSALVVAYHAATETRGALVVARARPPVRRVLEITRLDVLLDHHDDLSDAVAAVATAHDSDSSQPSSSTG
ncbi:MAG: STAS domain-containing protein [Jiangellaceae bacterium]